MNPIKSNAIRTMIALVSGIMFGAGLIISGMVNPVKVLAFLDITGNWDPSLAFVMGGALFVFAPCYHLLIKHRKTALNGDSINVKPQKQLDGKLISGAAIFGVGWGLAGFCPGPVIASLSGGSTTIISFLLSMIAGMVIARVFMTNPFIGAKCVPPSNASNNMETS